MGVANNTNRFVSFAAPGYGEGPERYSNYAPTTASSQWRLRQRGAWHGGDGGVEKYVATSGGGGRPSRQSRPERRWLFKGEYIT